ncbi:MAG TPA: tRNA pseudouridine(55) synthase TruB [Bacteroidia bacterium]|nr:tRNA pseudouridine(55) synthase TruB [Bacteroidia bacterium]
MDFLRLDYNLFIPHIQNINLTEGDIFLVDKPYKVTSFEVVNKLKIAIRKTFSEKIKVGHAGTLDPLATGLLIICTGKKTKQIEQIQALEKEYTGTFIIGSTTPCFDLERPVDHTYPIEHITRELILDTVSKFTGKQIQTPPVFSAVKVNGKRAYDLARGGEEEILVRAKEIEIKTFEITRVTLPEVDFKVVCSKGTYIRSLARDLGLALNSGAHLGALRRTRTGNFLANNAIKTVVNYTTEK